MNSDLEIIKLGKDILNSTLPLYLILIITITWAVIKFINYVVYSYTKFDEGQKYTLFTISKYFVFFFSGLLSLNIIGIDVTVLIAGSTALFVGIGLGLQNLFFDFISGIILLVDGTIKVGNVIEVKDKRVEIIAIRFRTSVVKTRDEKEIIVPNSFFTKNDVINWSNQKNINRHDITLQISDHNAEFTMELIRKIISSHPKVLSGKEPYVRIEKFTDYAIEIKALFWSTEIFAVGKMLGDIRLLILKGLKENNINLPFPQQSIYLKIK